MNPFAQIAACWQLSFEAPMEATIALEDAFADIAIAVSSFESPQDPSRWKVQILADHVPHDVEDRAARIAKALAIALSPPGIVELKTEDWQHSLARDFPPLTIGRFFVHGAHARAGRPPHLRPIQVEAGMAFGSGEHATTSLCLQAIDTLARQRRVGTVLDMGCGSGILAIAAARAWPKARIVAVDIDPVSARIARANMRLNGVRVTTLSGNGYANRRVREAAPYAMILANILARPLVRLAPDLRRQLCPGGVAVLSGLLVSQKAMVLSAHRAQGLTLKRTLAHQGWCALVMEG